MERLIKQGVSVVFDSYGNHVYYTQIKKFGGTELRVLEENTKTGELSSSHIMSFSGQCNHLKRVKYYDDWVIFIYCREIGKSQLHMVRNLNGVYANSYESVDPNFDRMNVHVLRANTFLISFYDSIRRTLRLRIFSFEKINGFKFLKFKNLKLLNNIMLYEIGHFDNVLFLALMKEGSQDMTFQKLTFFDNSITFGKVINTKQFLGGAGISNWACRPYNDKRLVCSFMFAA